MNTTVVDIHEKHGAVFVERSGRQLVAHYGRPETTHRAVRNGAGLIDHGYDTVAVTGEDRLDFVDDTVSNRVPRSDGEGVYALLLGPDGRIETDMYVFNAGERLLVVLPTGEGEPLAEEWREKTFIQDVTIDVLTDDLATFGVHGPKATEKIASVFTKGTPEEQLTFIRGPMGDAGATVVRTDGLVGEEGYLVVCGVEDDHEVFDTLETRGMNAAPFGEHTWESLTLEAGTPLFEPELAGQIPNVAGVRNGFALEKGCFVGQEVVSKVANRGRPSRHLVGLVPEATPEPGAAVFEGDSSVGEVTRAVESPSRGEPLALAYVEFGADGPFTVRINGQEIPANREALPLVDGSERSARLPAYPDA
jgi:aminomethyltransferase